MGRLVRVWYRVSASFWFLPGLIVVGAIVLALLAIEVDARFVTAGLLEPWPRLFGAGSSASRSLLTAVAGSMITVAGTVFSITLVALSLASSQYSSRVLRNFMRDRANQAVLGVFVGIFAYCLVVLRSIYGDGEDAFVPSAAVLLGLLLGFGGIGVLVFFIHHIAQSIQASRIIAEIRRETCRAIDRLFPQRLGSEQAGEPPPLQVRWHEARRADATGYLQYVDYERLHDVAHAHALRLQVPVRVGAFVLEGDVLLSASSLPPAELGDAVAGCWAIGTQRTLEQDVGFGIRQLVDVALKALSPGINDTTTAIMCIETLTAILCRLAPRELRFSGCVEDGSTWVEARHPCFGDLLDDAFDQIRQVGCDNPAVLDRLCWALGALALRTRVPARREALVEYARRVQETAARALRDPQGRARVQQSADALLATLGAPLD